MNSIQMNSIDGNIPSAPITVIKRHRNARKASFSDPEEFSQMTKILSNLETLKV